MQVPFILRTTQVYITLVLTRGKNSEVLYPEKVTDISDLDQIQGYERNNLIIKYGDLISL